MRAFLVAALPCALAAATAVRGGNLTDHYVDHYVGTDHTTKLSGRAAPILTEFTARLRCRSKSGAAVDDAWCQDNYLQSPTAGMCICDEKPSKQEIACSKVPGWEQPRSYLMAGCSASTFIGRATVEVLKAAGLCPFDFLDTRQSFLRMCEQRHYQFDSLRNAKHATAMMFFTLASAGT